MRVFSPTDVQKLWGNYMLRSCWWADESLPLIWSAARGMWLYQRGQIKSIPLENAFFVRSSTLTGEDAGIKWFTPVERAWDEPRTYNYILTGKNWVTHKKEAHTYMSLKNEYLCEVPIVNFKTILCIPALVNILIENPSPKHDSVNCILWVVDVEGGHFAHRIVFPLALFNGIIIYYFLYEFIK